jgi:hypothetical protein
VDLVYTEPPSKVVEGRSDHSEKVGEVRSKCVDNFRQRKIPSRMVKPI